MISIDNMMPVREEIEVTQLDVSLYHHNSFNKPSFYVNLFYRRVSLCSLLL